MTQEQQPVPGQHQELLTHAVEQWAYRLGTSELDPVILASHQALWANLETRNFHEVELEEIRTAEAVLLASLGTQVRRDGRPLPVHSLEVALIVSEEMQGNARSVTKALLHDTVEDSKDMITKDDIERLFGKRIASSVDALSKAKSHSLRDMPLRTQYKLLERVSKDPEDIAVKIADRLHFFRTVLHPVTGHSLFRLGQLAEKSRETMDLYVPLSVSLGFHYAEQELASQAIRYLAANEEISNLALPHTDDEYAQFLSPYQEFLDTLKQSGWAGERSKARPPRLDDAFKAVSGRISDIPQAEVPVIIALVVSGFGPEGNGRTIDPWTGSVGAIATEMRRRDLIGDLTLDLIHEQLVSGERSVRVTERGRDGIPARILFIRPEDDQVRYATVFDTELETDPAQPAALRKVMNLKTTFDCMLSPSMATTIDDMAYCLRTGGTLGVSVEKRKKHHKGRTHVSVGVSQDATWLDVLYATPGRDRVAGEIRSVVLPGNPLTLRYLGDPVEEDARIRFAGGGREFGPHWLDNARMPSTKRKIRQQLEESMQIEDLVNPDIDQDSIAYQAASRGYRIVSALFQEIARERAIRISNLPLPLTLAEDGVYRTENPRYVFQHPLSQYYNFLLSVGLELSGYVPNTGRTSIADKVARFMVSEMESLTNVRCLVHDSPGQLDKMTSVLAARNINIVSVQNQQHPTSPESSYVTFTIRAQELSNLPAEDRNALGVVSIEDYREQGKQAGVVQ